MAGLFDFLIACAVDKYARSSLTYLI